MCFQELSILRVMKSINPWKYFLGVKMGLFQVGLVLMVLKITRSMNKPKDSWILMEIILRM